MPITVTAPRDTLTPAGQREILPQLTAALIDASGQSGNSFFTPLVGGTVQILPPEQIYAGGVNRPLVLVELKLPDIGLTDPDARAAPVHVALVVERDRDQRPAALRQRRDVGAAERRHRGEQCALGRIELALAGAQPAVLRSQI